MGFLDIFRNTPASEPAAPPPAIPASALTVLSPTGVVAATLRGKAGQTLTGGALAVAIMDDLRAAGYAVVAIAQPQGAPKRPSRAQSEPIPDDWG